MKKLFMLICLFSVVMITFINGQQTNEIFLQNKIKEYEQLKAKGTYMILIGTASTIGGLITFSNAEWSGDERILTGSILSGIGVGLIAGGIVCEAIGHDRLKKYKRQLDALSLCPVVGHNKAGLMLTVRF